MTNRDLLKEAIADAKAVKETAIVNAKAALEEAFTPHLKSMLAAKLEELEKDEDIEEAKYSEEDDMIEEFEVNEEKDEIEEEFDLNEILAELEEGEDQDEMSEEVTEAETEEEAGEMEDEEIDLEDMTEDDLKSFIEDVIADMVAAGELEAGEEAEMEMDEVSWNEKNNPARGATSDKLAPTKVGQTTPAYAVNESKVKSKKSLVKEEEIDYTKLPIVNADTLKEIIKSLGQIKIQTKPGSSSILKNESDLMFKLMNDISFKMDRPGSYILQGPSDSEVTAGKGLDESKMNEALIQIKELKKELHEVNLLNAKLLYTNKIFKAKNLTESQKVKVLKAFDKAESVKETKIIFETLNEGIVNKSTKTSLVNEIKGSASKATGFIRENKQPIVEVDPMIARWQKLAGIIK